MVHEKSSAAATLPRPRSELVGRQRELKEVSALLLQTDIRLVTLTGPGGVGKTRLAVALGAELQSAFSGGTVYISLASLLDPALVLGEIAGRLGIRDNQETGLVDLIVERVGGEQMLIILDNVEQVVMAAGDLSALLSASPHVTLLTTSREPLHIQGELEYPVRPLSVGDDAVPGLWPAEELFIARAREASFDFLPTDDDVIAIRELCRRLDGLPLAIELAAPWIKILPPSKVLAGRGGQLDLLTRGSRDLPRRQQTMRDAISWSYDLLTPEEQRLFRLLAVFPGGFTLDAVAAVMHGDGSLGQSDFDLLDLVSSLVTKSLVSLSDGAESSDEPRYEMLQVVRAFAEEKLEQSEEADEARQRHLKWYLGLAEASIPELIGPDRGAWLERLDREHANIRAALAWTIDRGDAHHALALIEGTWRFWEPRGHLTEGRMWSNRALSLTAPVDSAVRAKALYGACILAFRQGDYDQARALCRESLALSESIDDAQGIAFALNGLGIIAYEEGDFDIAVPHHERALAIRRELNHTATVSISLNNLALVLYEQGDFERAGSMYREQLKLMESIGDVHGAGYALNGLGLVAHRLGDLDEAKRRHEGAVELRRGQDTGSLAASYVNLAAVERDHGNLVRAGELCREALALRLERGELPGISEALAGIAVLAAESGQWTDAVRLFGAVDSLRARIGFRQPQQEQPRQLEALEHAKEALPEDIWKRCRVEGEQLAVADAVILASRLRFDQVPLARNAPGATMPSAQLALLTPRERAVLALLVDGKSDQEIGDTLFISRATASRHVANIFQKIDVNSRAAAVAWAVRKGLVR